MKTIQILGNAAYGGSTYLWIEWAKFLVSQGWQVDVQSTDEQTVDVLRDIPGLRVIDTIVIPREVALPQDIKALLQLCALIRRKRYDIVHTGMTTAGFVARLAAWLAATPIILHDAQGWPATEYSSLAEHLVYAPLSYIAGMMSTHVICAGNATAALAYKLHTCPRDRLTVIANGIDSRPFVNALHDDSGSRLRRELGIPADYLLIGNANRLAPQKDNATLIRAMAHLSSLLPERRFQLLLAGDGPQWEPLMHLVCELGLQEQVRFLGFRRDIPAFLAAIDVFVNVSLWEGLSISLLEAMAAARPIVTSSILPNAELIVHEQQGLLVEPKSPAQTAHAIARLVREPQLARQCAVQAQQRAVSEYGIERRLQESWQLYQALLAAQPAFTAVSKCD